MRFASVQLDEDLIACVQVQDHAVAGIVVVLVCILGDGAGPYLRVGEGCGGGVEVGLGMGNGAV